MIFSRMTTNLGIKIRNMSLVQDNTVVRLRQVIGSAFPPIITPKTIRKKSCHKSNHNLLDYFGYPNVESDVSKKGPSRDTEKDVALTPSTYWPTLKGKTPGRGRVNSDDTSIVVSVNDRSQRNMTKRFDHLDIDWTAGAKQLLR
ncbi:hypothetical protein N7454_001500 [Penicillium verhagenii]|nr:hypothetical protein N7454_001500 [Penicillium verhagenii]